MPETETPSSPLWGPKILLIGAIGTGKSHAIRTLLDAGMEVFCVFTEPSGQLVLADTDPNRLHWHYIPPAAEDWSQLLDMGTKVNTMSYEMLCKLPDIGKQKFTQYLEVIQTLANFKDDRTGKTFGPVDAFDPASRALVIDSLSGLSTMILNLAIGLRPTLDKKDYGTAQRNIMAFLTKLTTGVPCTVVLTAHPEKEVNELTGAMDIYASSVGKAIAGQIPKYFSDVIMSIRAGSKWTWSTMFPSADLVARHLPWAADLPPSFAPLIQTWKVRRG